MICLLCGESLEDNIRFSDLMTLKKEQRHLCETCSTAFQKIELTHCIRCCKSGVSGICSDCLLWEEKGEIVNHQAIYQYNQAMKHYISQFKFMGDYILREVFAKEIKAALKPFKDYQFIPVPMDEENKGQRGFNQVEALLEIAGISYTQAFKKKKVQKQSSKTRQERLNSENPFQIKENIVFKENIIIIDDIYTTGATLRHVKSSLIELGIKNIRTFSLAR